MKLTDFYYQVKTQEGKPWLVFLHGLFGSLANWRKITPAFESEYNILTLDQRGHGRSFKPDTGYAPEDYADDLYFILNELKIDSIDLVGHSMGGRNGLAFAYKYPQLIKKLVVEDIGPQPTIKSGSAVIEKLKKLPEFFESKLAAKEYLLNSFGDPKIGMFMYSNVSQDELGRGVFSFSLKAMIETVEIGRGKDRWEEFRKIKCPTLIIRGERSEELTVSELERMLKENAHVRSETILGTGHWVHFDKPIEFINIVKKFLKNQ